jgi:heat shock protein HslJ
MNRYLPMLALPLALAACSKPSQDAPAAAAAAPSQAVPAAVADVPALSSYHWHLSQAKDAQGKRIDALFVSTDKPLQLDFIDGRLGVSNSCNRMSGAYAIQRDRLTVEPMAATQLACADARLMALDREAGQRLEGALTFKQAGDMLALTTASGDTLTLQGQPNAANRYGSPGETVFLEVAAQTKPCSHPLIPDAQCLQVREVRYDAQGLKTGADGTFENFYGNIQGYNHEPGIRNVLRVRRYAVKNPPADGSSLAYELDMAVESESQTP